MKNVNKSEKVCDQSFFKFSEEIEEYLKNDLEKMQIDAEDIDEATVHTKYRELTSWLQETPRNAVFRVNTLLTTSDEVIKILESSKEEKFEDWKFEIFPNLPELLVVSNKINPPNSIILHCEEAVVDAACGAAVLRGAQVFAPGVMGLTSGAKVGDVVSVFADTSGSCKKGITKPLNENSKKFVGNGILLQNRNAIFLNGASGTGIAIKMTQIASNVPQLNEQDIPRGFAILQNFPSTICARILNPQPGETIVDLCAAPGNKTTHVAALMDNRGILVALEKVKSKIDKLKNHCENLRCENVRVFCVDSTKSLSDEKNRSIEDGPPFSRESFDRVLLDGPCSGLGRRPQIFNKISAKELGSFVALQRKLFSVAVELLKTGGVLVYSTCTVTVAENEGIVAWALKTFPNLQLTSAREKYDSFDLTNFPVSPGYCTENLSPEDAHKLLRFGPGGETVGFFIAAFVKR